jgi:hypothetical protein
MHSSALDFSAGSICTMAADRRILTDFGFLTEQLNAPP